MKIVYKSILLLFVLCIPFFVKAEEIEVTTFTELVDSINDNNTIIIKNDIEFNALITIDNNIVIKGDNYKLIRASEYKGRLFTVSNTGNLTIENLTIDGAASGWQMDYENRHYTKVDNKGYVRVPTTKSTDDIEATAVIINNAGTLNFDNVTMQNVACSLSGCGLSSNGNNTINNSLFKHIGSAKNGGAFYLSGGNTTITNSTFEDDIAGYGVETSINGGAIYAVSVASLNISDTTFKDNLAQGNGGSMFITKTNLSINNSTFKHNMVGNDGSAIDLENNTTTSYNALVENSTFENNYGLATTGQSMGTVWIGSKFSNTQDNPLIFRNLVFKENIARVGAGLADNSPGTYIKMENIEVYNNEVNSGSLLYAQQSIYDIKNVNVHNNTTGSGAGIYINGADLTVDDSTIKDNTTTGSGAGIYVLAGNLTLKNSEITNNTTTEGNGGGLFIRGYYEGYVPQIIIQNSLIKDNNSAKMGGGIFVRDNEDLFSSINIDDSSRIYDNNADETGDDFVYIRDNNTDNNTGNTITLDNISIAGILGIDGWYHDNANARFAHVDNPEKFDNYTNYNGYGIYLKAAGVNEASYDLQGGSGDNIDNVTLKYGQEYTVSDNEPSKDGYEFVGWNTREDGSGTWLNAGDTYDGKDGLVLYAQYNEITVVTPEPDPTPDPNPDPISEEKPTNIGEINPSTGDSIVQYIIISMISFICMISIVVTGRRKSII